MHVLLVLYSTLVLAYLNYGILAWGNAPNIHMERMLLIQKRTRKIMNNTAFHSHTKVLFLINKILKVHDLYYLNLGILMFQLNIDMLLHAMESLFFRNNQIHLYPTRQSENLNLPFTRNVSSQKFLIFMGPKCWNELDTSLKQVTC